jgi:prepilin-type N-terminal cleavage/methylation domain-containing protein
MSHTSHLPSGQRTAFTLIEMLVVLALMLILAALAVAFVPKLSERARAARGGEQLQQWLLVARQWAKRDRVPTGLRLQPGQSLPNRATPLAKYVTDLQYIQRPEDLYFPNSIIKPAGPHDQVRIVGANIDFYGGVGQGAQVSPGPPPVYSNQGLWLVQPGDYLEIQGGGQLHRILALLSSGNVAQKSDILLLHPVVNGTFDARNFTPTSRYRIIRSPRILPGEPALQLPQDIAIDLTKNDPPPPPAGAPNTCYGNPLQANVLGSIDILFSPAGSVLGQPSDKVILWVRDVTQDAAAPGDQTLITVFVRTGFIAAFPVDLDFDATTGRYVDPYSFTRTGRSSGL